MKQIDNTLLDSLTKQAKESTRKRAHYNLHPKLDDPIQRLCVAIEPETYIRPHRHAEPETSEVFLLLRGSAVLLCFDDTGRITEKITVSAGGPVPAVEIPAVAWHTIASLEGGTVFFEVKQGPYVQPKEKNVALWAPAEGKPGTGEFVEWYKNAKEGDRPPVLR
jgi:cupin fold WbuC family metalloprotein